MLPEELESQLQQLIQDWENECVEFKDANDNFSTSDIGKYFSALSNEANLKGRSSAWLVFGVDNQSRTIIGTEYRREPERLQSLKKQISDGSLGTFKEIHELQHGPHRVILFEIPPAPQGIPTPWNGHYFSRAHESLTALSDAKRDQIRHQPPLTDWSAGICEKASLQDLSPPAIKKARESFTAKHSERIPAETIASWSDREFLDRSGLCINGQVTRTAILLVGQAHSIHHLSPQVAEITWKLDAEEKSYEHFHPPFILNTSLLYQKIRNTRLTLMRPGDLVPVEIGKYDQRIVLEALHNCLAHQDYTLSERVLVTERLHELIFQNAGTFFDGQPDDYISSHKTPTRYRNRFLATAMVNLRMIDSLGLGIHEIMFRGQAKRYLPLPDFETSSPSHVILRLPGRFIDEKYSHLLLNHPNLTFPEIRSLDDIQKGRLPSDEAALKILKDNGLIEGRRPNFRIAPKLLESEEEKVNYIKHRAFDDPYYCDLILAYLQQNQKAPRSAINRLLEDKLSSALDPKQKRDKIRNLLQKLKKSGQIKPLGSTSSTIWILAEDKTNLPEDNLRQ